MKTSMLLLVSAMVLSVTAHAQIPGYVKIATCSAAPAVEGEISVYLSKDRKEAVVEEGGLGVEAQITSLGPVATFDYQSPNASKGVSRVIIAVDGGHELHYKAYGSSSFRKVSNLVCNR